MNQEAERIALELLQPIDGFEEPTYLETQAAEMIRKLQAENESLRSQLDAALVDAKRYRLIRDPNISDRKHDVICYAVKEYAGNALDTAIDDVIAALARIKGEPHAD